MLTTRECFILSAPFLALAIAMLASFGFVHWLDVRKNRP